MIEQRYLLNRLIKQACYHKQAYIKKVAMLKKLSSGNMEKTAFDLSAIQPILAEAGNFASQALNPVNLLAMIGYMAAPVGAKDFAGNRNAAMGYKMFAEANPEMVIPHMAASMFAPILGKKILPKPNIPANYKRPESMLETWLKGAIPYYKAKFHIGEGKVSPKTIQKVIRPEVVQNIVKQAPQINNAAQKAVQKINPYKMLGAAGVGLAVPLTVGGLYKYLQNRNKSKNESASKKPGL